MPLAVVSNAVVGSSTALVRNGSIDCLSFLAGCGARPSSSELLIVDTCTATTVTSKVKLHRRRRIYEAEHIHEAILRTN